MDNRVCVGVTGTRLVDAIANTVAKVGVGAKASGVGLVVYVRASEVTSLSEHVADTNLLERVSMALSAPLECLDGTHAAWRKVSERLSNNSADDGGSSSNDRLHDE